VKKSEINIKSIKMETTDEYRQERLINVNEIYKIMSVGRTCFSQEIDKNINKSSRGKAE